VIEETIYVTFLRWRLRLLFKDKVQGYVLRFFTKNYWWIIFKFKFKYKVCVNIL